MIPHDEDIIHELLTLLDRARDGTMHCNEVYVDLAKSFPELSEDDLIVPYRNSKSLWANRVQFARLHCVQRGHILSEKAGRGRSLWTITEKGRREIRLARAAT